MTVQVSPSLAADPVVFRKTTAGAPTAGTWRKGDWCVDSAGKVYACTASGTPGTWVEIAAASAVAALSASVVTLQAGTFGAGLNVTGHIVVSGNVDGRDVSVDGTSLDALIAQIRPTYQYTGGGSLQLGQVVYINGSGSVAKAQADNLARARAVGVALSTVTNNNNVVIQVAGRVPVHFVTGLTLAAGDNVFISGTGGRATNVVPGSGNYRTYLGRVANTASYAASALADVIWEPGEETLIS